MKTSRTKTTISNLIFEYAVVLLSIVSGVILVPLYLKFIPIDLYGAWLATGNIVVWLTVLDPGLSLILQQLIGTAYGKKDNIEIAQLICGGIYITFALSLAIFLIGLIMTYYIPEMLGLPPSVNMGTIKAAFLLSVVGSSLMFFSYSMTAINRGLQCSSSVGVIIVTTRVITIIMSITLLYKGYGLIGLAISSVICGVGFIVGNSIILSNRLSKNNIQPLLLTPKIIPLLKLMSMSSAGRASSVLSNNMDLFFVARYLGPESVTILNLTRKAPEISKMFIERPSTAFMPAVSHLLGAGELVKAQNVLLRLIRILLWVLGLLFSGFIILNDDFVRLWVGQHFYAGDQINLIICINLVFTVCSTILGNLCFALGNIKGNSIITFLQSMLTIPLMIYGIKYFGVPGAVIAPMIPMLTITIWYYQHSFARLVKLSRLDYIAFSKESIVTAIASIIVAVVFRFFIVCNWLQFICIVFALIITYTTLLYLFSFSLRCELRGVALIFLSRLRS